MSLHIITRRTELQFYLSNLKNKCKTIGFVPTMGALHDGHGSLMKTSLQENDVTLVSLFVNPKQFAPNEDFLRYPRTFEDDVKFMDKLGVHCVFAPTAEEMYPQTFASQVRVAGLTEFLCGVQRPGHFDGVTTVVLLLMNLMQANKMYLGQKDFQQVQVIMRMATDLAHPTQIVMVPTVRESDGLALSSRNRFLTPEARKKAACLPAALACVAKAFLAGERQKEVLRGLCMDILKKENFVPQYLEFRLAVNLLKKCEETLSEPTVLAIAQMVEVENQKVRLSDNILLGSDVEQTHVLNDLILKVFGR